MSGWQFWARGFGIGIELEKSKYEHQTLIAQYQTCHDSLAGFAIIDFQQLELVLNR